MSHLAISNNWSNNYPSHSFSKILFISFFLMAVIGCQPASAPKNGANLDFELMDGLILKGWEVFGESDGYVHLIDDSAFYSGNQSVSIEHIGPGEGFKAWSYSIPAIYQGDKITLRGYIKTENVSDGWAGLWMRIDPSVSFDNMQQSGITGTTDWTQYEITLDLKPLQASSIAVGGLLVGKGKMWLDKLEVYIDGIPLESAPSKQPAQAGLDSEFDKSSDISISSLDETTLRNLVLMGKVWGFLKYYHPAVARGDYNWDFELFRVLPALLKISNYDELNSMLIQWINGLGKIEPCLSCEMTSENAVLAPDLEWVSDSGLSEELELLLMNVYANRSQGANYYVRPTSNVQNPQFINENSYDDMRFPDDGYRLLAIYRFWNMIQYFFPYRYVIDKNWSDVLLEYIPSFINAQNEFEYELAVLLLINEVHDTHVNLWGGADKVDKWKGEYYPPVFTRMIEDELVVTDFYTSSQSKNKSMAKKVGLNIGDVITKINGTPVKELITERISYYPASNYATKLRDIAPDLLRSNNSAIDIEYVRDGIANQKTIELFKKSELDFFSWYRRESKDKSYRLLENNIGYITLQNITAADVHEIKSALQDTKGIVIDIRNYPSTFVPFTLGSFFVDEDTPFVKFTVPNYDNPGEFIFTEELVIPKANKTYDGKLVVLINEFTQSQAEYTAMAFRAGANTTIIGSTTAGADGNVSRLSFPGGLTSMISGIGVYYPDGTQTQRIGIVPDLEVRPTIQGIKSGKDEPLDKAIELINIQ